MGEAIAWTVFRLINSLTCWKKGREPHFQSILILPEHIYRLFWRISIEITLSTIGLIKPSVCIRPNWTNKNFRRWEPSTWSIWHDGWPRRPFRPLEQGQRSWNFSSYYRKQFYVQVYWPQDRVRHRALGDGVEYYVGQIFKHKKYGYYGVITGWDRQCNAPMNWKQQMLGQ